MLIRDLAHKGLIGTQILLIRGHGDLDLAQQRSSGPGFGSSGLIRGHLDSHLAHQGSSGSSGHRFDSSGVIGTQIWLIGGH